MKTTELIENIKSKKLGDTVFVIGGGPSVLSILPDRSVLDNKPVIATNNAYQLFPKAIVTHFADRQWYLWHKDQIKEFKGPVSSCVLSYTHNNAEFPKLGIVSFIHGDRKGGIETDNVKLGGNNAGHQAINIAYYFGFKNIILIGFDMNPNDKRSHWHSAHKRATNFGNYEGTMIPGMKTIVPFQEKLGFKVWNANPEAYLKCFEFTDINKWL